jgi:hypothetical protein
MSDFWERQAAKQRKENPGKPVYASQPPWWAGGTNLAQSQTVPSEPAQSRTDGNLIDGHDVSKAGILRGAAEECPNCPPDPTTGIRGNLYRPTPNSAMRCFDCGYMENNRFLGETVGMSAVAEGPTQRARQVASGGGEGSQYRGEIKSANQAVGRLN